MKKLVALLTLVSIAPSVFGQGAIAVNNVSAADGVKAQGGPLDGKYVGGDFTVEMWYAVGAVVDDSALAIYAPAVGQFFGATGGGPTVDGAGLFDLGVVNIAGVPAGNLVTVQLRASGGIYAGRSALGQYTLAGGVGFPPDTSNIGSFVVVPIPEPSTFALAGLGAAALLIFRRRA